MKITIWPAPGYDVSVVAGEVQNSDAHVARGGSPAIDIAAPVGTPLKCCSTTEAQIVLTGYDDQCGIRVWFEWREDDIYYRARYCHLSTPCPFPPGAKVQPGDIIGWSGNTGNSQGPHLHWVLERLEDDGTWIRLRIEDYFTEEDVGMTQEQKDECLRIANIFNGWLTLRRAMADTAYAFGYGLDDSLSRREADELEGAVKSLVTLAQS